MTTDSLTDLRREAMRYCMNQAFSGGRRQMSPYDEQNFFAILRPQCTFALWASHEYADPQGPWTGNRNLRDAAVEAIDIAVRQFQPTGHVGAGDMNSPYFTLVPLSKAMMNLKGHVDEAWHGDVLDRCVQLVDAAPNHIPHIHDYLNPRGIEAVSLYNLACMTGETRFEARAVECLDELLKRQYPCGAQPYHTGMWVWGRKPAQVYQLLTVTMMFYLGRALGRQDAIEYVRRLLRYELLATNRHGEQFITTAEGLHKSGSRSTCGFMWPLVAAMDDRELMPLGVAAYRLWAELVHQPANHDKHQGAYKTAPVPFLGGLENMSLLRVGQEPQGPTFAPQPGVYAIKDTSTVFLHEPNLDAAMTLLTGYAAWAEADVGSVKLYALTPELTDNPTYRNAGTDPLRQDWQKAEEQIVCEADAGRSELRGRSFTKWILSEHAGDQGMVHTRELEVTMTYGNGEMVLAYRTVKNTRPEPVPSRLLVLLIARPLDASGQLSVDADGETQSWATPPAAASEEFHVDAPVGTVRFLAPDGTGLEIIPELTRAHRITAERPATVRIAKDGGGKKNKHKTINVKQANEGSLRLAFEGPDVLDEGRYRIRFIR